jgi:hypothetical protein
VAELISQVGKSLWEERALGTKVVSADEARKNFAELLNTATYGNGRIQIMRRGKVAGFIIGPKDMAQLEAAQSTESNQAKSPPHQAELPPQKYREEVTIPDETASWEELEEELGSRQD